MILLLTILAFVLGLVVGSFLNVVILRLNTGKTFGGRSACMSCRRELSWYELVPVASYLGLGGKCRSCKTHISLQYPLVEIVTGIVFAGLLYRFQGLLVENVFSFSISYAYYIGMFSILLVIAVYDLKHKIIPDSLSLVFGLLAFLSVFLFVQGIWSPHIPAISEFLGGIIISVPFALLWLVSRGAWMGLGDAKLAVGLGFLLGTLGMISATIISFWVGAVIGIALLIFFKHYGRKSEIPFAPFLVLSTFIVFIFEIYLPIF
jgi:prepilin signal peptidase PulO-like enzyme (type II secretory pathway)